MNAHFYDEFKEYNVYLKAEKIYINKMKLAVRRNIRKYLKFTVNIFAVHFHVYILEYIKCQENLKFLIRI